MPQLIEENNIGNAAYSETSFLSGNDNLISPDKETSGAFKSNAKTVNYNEQENHLAPGIFSRVH